MTTITRIGLDIAKSVFEVHAVNAQEQVVLRRSLRRNQVLSWFAKLPPCLIGMEARGTANHWARELTALGHTVRLIPPAYAKPYVRRNKNDAADAAAICEAVSRPSMRFVPIKTVEQQADTLTHKARQLLIKQRTMAMNALRGLMAEFGVIVPQGPQHIGKLLAILADPDDTSIPAVARTALNTMRETLAVLETQIDALEAEIKRQARANPTARRLDTIPGFGLILSGACAAIVTEPKHCATAAATSPRPRDRARRQRQHRRQNQTRPHQQTRQRIPPAPAGERSHGGADREECQKRPVAREAA